MRILDGRASLVFAVRDMGCGVDAEFERRMFDQHVTSKEGHAGIGLALVRGIALRANGRISVLHPPAGGLEIAVEVPK